MKRFELAFVAANKFIVAAILAAIFTIVFVNVVGRYGFATSFAWVEESARHLMILGVFCGAGLALRQGRLVAIESLVAIFPKHVEIGIRWLVVATMFAFMSAMGWLGIQFVEFGWPKETMSTGMSRGLPYLSIPIGCGLFLIHLILFARRFVAYAFEIDEDPDRSLRGAG